MSIDLSGALAYISTHKGWFGFLAGNGVMAAVWGFWEKVMTASDRLAETVRHWAGARKGWHESTEAKVRTKQAKADLKRKEIEIQREMRQARVTPNVAPEDWTALRLPIPYSCTLILLPFRDNCERVASGTLQMRAHIKFQHEVKKSSTIEGVWINPLDEWKASSVGTNGSQLIILESSGGYFSSKYLTSDLQNSPLVDVLFGGASRVAQVGTLILDPGHWLVTITVTVAGFRKNHFYDLILSIGEEPKLKPVNTLERFKRKLRLAARGRNGLFLRTGKRPV
jgi:hypothetical protein